MKKDFEIDLVYLWVNGNDQKWLEEKEEWQTRLGICSQSTNNCRFIDNQELKYSLRSVEMNAPWINKIFIVTNGQVPEWLDTSHPKIKIITHKEIMPADALPTFNSEAIETCIANIPELSEHFLYANDDTFINSPVSPDFFFDGNGNPIVRLVKHDWKEEIIAKKLYLKNVIYSMNLIKDKYGKEYKYEASHNIDAYRKSHLNACKQEFIEEFERTCRYKFRTENSVQRTIFSYWMLANALGTPIFCQNRVNDKTTKLEVLHQKITAPDNMKQTILKFKPSLLCINDGETVNPNDRKSLKGFLTELYPQKQEWEKEFNLQIEPVFDSHNYRTIVFAPDNNYCKYFSAALQSLIDNSKNFEDYDIIVFETDISERNKDMLQRMLPPNFSLRFFDITECINQKLGQLKLQIREYWSVSMYYRIFIPMIMQKYKRVLYCDSDVVTSGPLKEFFEIDFEDKEILAVIDTVSPVVDLFKERYEHLKNELQLSNPQNYFNSGIIMFNIEQIDLQNYMENLHRVLEVKTLLFPDQDILNMIFEGKVKLVSCRWNYQYGVTIFNKNYENIIYGDYKKDFLQARKYPVIIHYTSSRKPWHSPKEEWADRFWFYARKSPFYEEILYNHIKSRSIKEDTLKNINLKWKIYYNYYRAKLLSFVTFGKRRTHYVEKRDRFKQRVRDIRKFSRL